MAVSEEGSLGYLGHWDTQVMESFGELRLNKLHGTGYHPIKYCMFSVIHGTYIYMDNMKVGRGIIWEEED